MNVYKMYHQDCLSHQEAIGCINDAIATTVTLWSLLKGDTGSAF